MLLSSIRLRWTFEWQVGNLIKLIEERQIPGFINPLLLYVRRNNPGHCHFEPCPLGQVKGLQRAKDSVLVNYFDL